MNENFSKIQNFLNALEEQISFNDGAKLVRETYLPINNKIRIIDALITVNKKPLAVFEFKENVGSLNNQGVFSLADDIKVDIRFIIISNGAVSKVIDTYHSKFETFKEVYQLVEYLFKGIEEKDIRQIILKIKKEIEAELLTFKRHLNGLLKLQKNEILISKIAKIEAASALFRNANLREMIQWDKDGQFFHMVSDIRDFDSLENQFLKNLIDDVPKGTFIYRYSSLDTVEKTIEFSKIRLSGIVGMNDISEVGYVEQYLDKKFQPMTDDDQVDSVNRKFIMCGSIQEDELMQWRLYGDDCKGGCLVFEVFDNSELPGLLLRKISYGVNINGENYHPELELLLRIQRRIKNNLRVRFEFRTLEIWKHFFKSFEYASEQEVRLLLIGNKAGQIKAEKQLTGIGNPIEIKWNLTSSHQILAPFILLQLDDNRLRFRLSKVLLGVKCPEIGVNLKQFKYLLSKQNLGARNVEPSKIKNYR